MLGIGVDEIIHRLQEGTSMTGFGVEVRDLTVRYGSDDRARRGDLHASAPA